MPLLKNAGTKNAVIENLRYTQSWRLKILSVFLLILFFKERYHHEMINYYPYKQTFTQNFEPA